MSLEESIREVEVFEKESRHTQVPGISVIEDVHVRAWSWGSLAILF